VSGLLVPVLTGTLHGLARTWHVSVRGSEHRDRLEGRPFLFALWHATLLPLLWWHRRQPIALLVSRHRDGEIVARAAARLGYGLVRGSSTRGGGTAFRRTLQCLAEGTPVAVTPDGPAGPARVVKPGVIRAARRASVPILPVTAVADRSWHARSWDGLCIPRPRACVTIRYGVPLVGRDLDDPDAPRLLQASLDRLLDPAVAAA